MTPNEWADFWYDTIGVNVIPAITKTKKPIVEWKKYQTDSIPLKIFNSWKKDNKFDLGMAVILGEVFRGKNKGLWLNGLDCDNNYGIDSLCPTGINNVAKNTLIEQHNNKNKAHIYYYTDRPIKGKTSNNDLDSKGKALPQIEVKSEGKKLLYCAGGHHKDGSLIDIVGIKIPKKIDSTALEQVIENIYLNTEISYLNGKSNLKIGKGIKNLIKNKETENSRNDSLYQTMKDYFKRNLDLEAGTRFGLDLNAVQNTPPLPEKEVITTIESAFNSINENTDSPENKPYTNKQWPEASHDIQSNDSFITVRETGDMWKYSQREGVYIPNADTYISEEAEKLIFKCTTKSRNEIKNTIKANQTMILSTDFFDSTVINTESGIIDPNTFDVLPHSPKYKTTTKLPFAVKMKSDNYKLFLHIVNNIIESKDTAMFLEILWVLISWNNPHKKCIIFKGVSDTQKTTLMEIITWIIGKRNIATEKAQKFLSSGDKFTMSRFIGKRGNFSEEINNLTPEQIENMKAMIGGFTQDTEFKNSNDGREFDPKRFLLLFSTNYLDSVYQKIDDNSTLNRIQFMMFKNVIKSKKGNWEKDFFINDEDKKTCIETIIRLVLDWKKSGKEVKWDEPYQTKEILRADQPIEDKYFESGRIIKKTGGKLILDDIKLDIERFCDSPIESHTLGYLMKKQGYKGKPSNGKIVYYGFALNKKNTKNEVLG